jgi:hypothetical protein
VIAATDEVVGDSRLKPIDLYLLLGKQPRQHIMAWDIAQLKFDTMAVWAYCETAVGDGTKAGTPGYKTAEESRNQTDRNGTPTVRHLPPSASVEKLSGPQKECNHRYPIDQMLQHTMQATSRKPGERSYDYTSAAALKAESSELSSTSDSSCWRDPAKVSSSTNNALLD